MPDYLGHFPEPFLEDMVQGRCLPFVGAGFSLNAKIPKGKKMLDWDGLGKKVAAALPEYQYTSAVEALSAYSHEFTRVKLVELLSSALLITTIQPAKTHEEFCRLPFERVVTTNFDFLLEQAYARISKYCIPLISEDQLAVGDSQAGVRLLKLHGDLHHPNRLVVTEEDYDAFLTSLPLLATHLSSLLIDHTALFIGYSLDDPDFRQIWQVVKDRLGALRRPAYVLQVGAPAHTVARYERRGVKVINLPKTPNRSYGEILEIVFRELLEYWSSKIISLSTATEPEPQAELSLPSSAQSRLAFFSVPTRYAAVYKARIYPIAERYGFSPIMATDVATPGDNLMAKVYALIERSAIVFADLSSPNTMLEVGMALSKEGMAKPLILITEDQATVPFDIASHQVIRRPRSLDEESPTFIKAIEAAFAEAFSRISPSLEDEPNRLLQKKEYRAAVLAAFSLLEHDLRQLLELSGLDSFASRSSLGMLLEYAKKEEVFTVKEYQRIRAHMIVRNRIAHTRVEVSAAQAKTIVREIAGATAKLRDANLTRRSSVPTTA
ncbi:SIR2 family protein [Pseudomonas sp. D(2018)]|uniref:SIR2 family NAD-dependent protein deacylase n=1 Tax=Pseudomonas sp. D(2018) TaxID=2502238 RepID=UPI0010F466E6|nr:SIR2 family protein [Pseudomonas sp. D(2018)]